MESLSSQIIVDTASERMAAIIKMKVIEPVKPGESKVQVWHSAMKELREQLDIIRPSMVSRAQKIPRFAVAAEIHLSASATKREWPEWSAIIGADVSPNPDHPWLNIGRLDLKEVPQSNDEDISMEEVPIVGAPVIHGEGRGAKVDRKGKGKEKEVVAAEEPVRRRREEAKVAHIQSQQDGPTRGRGRAPSRAPSAKDAPINATKGRRSQGTSREPSESPDENAPKRGRSRAPSRAPSGKDVPLNAPKGRRNQGTSREPSESSDENAPKRGRSRVSSRAPPKDAPIKAPKGRRSQGTSEEPSEIPDEGSPVAEGPCETCAQRSSRCTPREGKACLQCNQRKVKCSLAPQRIRPVAPSQPLPTPLTNAAPPEASIEPTEKAKTSEPRNPRAKSRPRRPPSPPSSPDIPQAPIKLKIPQSKKRAREDSPSAEKQTRKVQVGRFDGVVITSRPISSLDLPAMAKECSLLRSSYKDLAKRMDNMEGMMQSLSELMGSFIKESRAKDKNAVRPTVSSILLPFERQKDQADLDPSANVSSRPSAETSAASLPPSSSAVTSAVDRSTGSPPASHPPSALLGAATPDGTPPQSAKISPLVSVPQIVVSLPELGRLPARPSPFLEEHSAAATNLQPNPLAVDVCKPLALFPNNQGIDDSQSQPTETPMEE